MNLSKKSIWWIVSAAVLVFSLSNIAGIAAMDELKLQRKVILSLIMVCYFTFHWLAVYWISQRLQKRYPNARQDRTRLIKTYVYSALVLLISMLSIDSIQNIFLGKSYTIKLSEFLSDLFQAMGIAILIVSLMEAFYQYFKNQQSERANAELMRVNLLAQYNNLKQQVNPHFLFNSLNTLSSLISIDPQRAENFISELSLVYRYLLHNSQDELVALSKELHFLNSYVHLIKTRFGSGLFFAINVPDNYRHYLIPPLSLQLLVENAVKHNEVSPENPLHIEISITPDLRIRVTNNLQEKNIAVPSEKVGLVNIMAKYRLLGQDEVIVLKTTNDFSVSLPLIKSEIHERTDR